MGRPKKETVAGNQRKAVVLTLSDDCWKKLAMLAAINGMNRTDFINKVLTVSADKMYESVREKLLNL